MGYYMAKIEVLIDADSEADACDVIAQAMKPALRVSNPDSSIIDWRYHSTFPQPHSGDSFEYGEVRQ